MAISRYGGALWQTDWLESNDIFVWHKAAKASQIERAKHISTEMFMDEIDKLMEQGIYVMDTIKSGHNAGKY